MLKEKMVVPVVFAANNEYTLFCYIAIYSMIKYASSKNKYEVYVFETGMEKENQELLESLTNHYVSVKCINISAFTEHIELKESIHLSIETYYRLFIPIVLPQYEKILYLDSDMCILSDVAELYMSDLRGKSIGAVRDVWCEYLKRHSIEIGGMDFKKTFNAGVLVMDTRKFEEERIREKCLVLLAEDYKRKVRKMIFADQDALNNVLYENITFLNDKWNCQSQFAWRPEVVMEEYRRDYFKNLEDAYIMHFAGDKKPWMYPELPKSEVFWDVAKETKIHNKLLALIMENIRKQADRLTCFDVFQFPYQQISYGSRIVIYAAGMVGQAFKRQIELSKYANVVLWVDKAWETMPNEMEVKSIYDINKVEYDYVVIAIDEASIAEKIRNNLLELGVQSDKIVWNEYRKQQNQ